MPNFDPNFLSPDGLVTAPTSEPQPTEDEILAGALAHADESEDETEDES